MYWDTQDRYIELMNFEMEVLNILETKAYELSEEESLTDKFLVLPKIYHYESLWTIKIDNTYKQLFV